MLYTRKGDGGTTKLFDCPPGVRVSKSAKVFEVLGTLDELNSSIGFAKTLARKRGLKLELVKGEVSYEEILETLQQTLFCVQAELGGSKISATKEHVLFEEEVTDKIETLLPPIKNFIIPGGSEAGAYLDICRTITRRAERGCVMLRENKEREIQDTSMEFLNRLSSALYALARYANLQEGYVDKNPSYQ